MSWMVGSLSDSPSQICSLSATMLPISGITSFTRLLATFLDKPDRLRPMMTAVDLFCGAGGLTKGLENESIDVVAGYDLDPECRYPFEANTEAEFVLKDISEIEADELEQRFPDDTLSILVGCAPCQPFSSMAHGYDKSEEQEWGLLTHFSRLVREVTPDYIAMENVIPIRKHEPYQKFVKTLLDSGYSVSKSHIDCREYGVPQTRNRLVVLASRGGEIDLVDPTHDPEKQTVRKTIGELPRVEAGEIHPRDQLHQSRNLAEINLRRIRASEPGETWEIWPEELMLECHKKSSGRTYNDSYGRMEWDKAAPTITTQATNYGTGRFGHPEQDRALTVREAAMLQTFPEEYEFVEDGDSLKKHKTMRYIGNAVPVKLAEAIGQSFKQHAKAS